MDIFERLFEVSTRFLFQKDPNKRLSHAAYFEEHFETLNLLASVAASGAILDLKPTEKKTCLQGHTLWLPRVIFSQPHKKSNQFILFNLALVGGVLYDQKTQDIDLVRYKLSEIFPGYPSWQSHYGYIEEAFLVEKRIEAFSFSDELKSQQKQTKITTEMPSGSTGPVESVELEQKKKDVNPLMHSFEKLETADEYHGENRILDSSDELQIHSHALSELHLDKVTRSGEGSSSLYQADMTGVLESESKQGSELSHAQFLYYPEWHFKNHELQPEYCKLYIDQILFPEDGELGLKNKLQSQYYQNIEYWKNRLAFIYQRRGWKDKQLDGDELDIDSYARYLSDIKSSGSGDVRVFQRRVRCRRDRATLIVMDQSYSTDSYVQGRRVLDIQLECIGLMGLLLEEQKDPVGVAGTWSLTRNHCCFQLYKDFEAPWKNFFKTVPMIEPAGYTRLGPAIRHATELLKKTGAKRKLLLMLTDGKPTDYDRYEGRYGIEDIHHAFLEAKQYSIQCKAFAIQEEAKKYFPNMFGTGNYNILLDPNRLPECLFRIYLQIE